MWEGGVGPGKPYFKRLTVNIGDTYFLLYDFLFFH